MDVFKFGGASVANADRIKNLGTILGTEAGEERKGGLLIVISALGKTTNALEKVSEAFFEGRKDDALILFGQIRTDHINLSQELGVDASMMEPFFTEVEWLLHDKPVRNYDYYYDQVVCVGELLSTSIVSAYLNKEGIQNTWLDVRDFLRTDNNFRDAVIDWEITSQKIKESVQPLLKEGGIVIVQGFIGSTDDNESTTLGREGSDYTAAVFANILDASAQTIWKDVPGVMNADPKEYAGAKLISRLSYREVIEMAYYGAQVIHPKTIKPLRNKKIPLKVRSFVDPSAPGTTIEEETISNLPPIIVYKKDQVLMELSSSDFSFVGESLSTQLLHLFNNHRIKPNLMQNAAISILCVTDDGGERTEALSLEAGRLFDVQVSRGFTLLTIRHYNEEILNSLTEGKNVVLRQQTPETVQLVLN